MKATYLKFLTGLAFPLLLSADHSYAAEEPIPQTINPITFGKNGISFTHPDNLFQVNLRFRMQNLAEFRSGFNADPGFHGISAWDARVRRLRLRLGGFAFDPRLTYNIQLSFTREDIDWESSRFPNIVRDAAITYRFNSNFALMFGQTKLPGNRQRIISSGDQQFPDRSIVNREFNIDRDFGLQAILSGEVGQTLMNLRMSATTGSGRNRPGTTGSNPEVSPISGAYAARAEFLPFGAFTDGGDYFEGDLIREPKPKLSVGASHALIRNGNRANGTIGRFFYLDYSGTSPVISRFPPSGTNWAPLLRDMQLTFVDWVLKWQGFAFSGEFAHRSAPDPILGKGSDGKTVALLVGSGINIQTSYLLTRKFELATRFSQIMPDQEVQAYQQRVQQFGLGGSYYLAGHRVKLQSDLTQERRLNYSNSSNRTEWIWRVNFELGI
jgi:hypothetical protein